LNDAGLDIVLVPKGLTPSIEDCTVRELFEFTTRQMKITRVYKPELWALSFFGSALFTVVMLAALLIMIFSSRNNVAVAAAMFTLLVVTIFSIGKSWLRMKAVHLVLPEYRARLRRQMLPQITLWAVTPALFFYNSLAAWISRRVTWRGAHYQMISANETRILE
jgi:hypothetical protein